MGEEANRPAALPSGTLTFLFTDIEGSTLRWENSGDHMARCVARYDEIMRSTADRMGGHVVKSIGDGTMAVFANADHALSAALQGQQELGEVDWTPVPPVRVRMGLHTGWTEPIGHDYVGSVVNRAARIADAGHGRQIILSASTAGIVDSDPGVSLVSRGHHRLKDLSEPLELFQVVSDVTSAELLPLRTLGPEVRDLPTQRTSFIGRDDDVTAVDHLLESWRLVTLTGIGGVGKTRLAVQAAAEAASAFADGVRFVDLFSTSAGTDLASSVRRQLLGTGDPTAAVVEEPIDALARAVGDREMLLVLDNCEHVVDQVAPMVDALLGACPHLRLLATSREALRVPGEHVVPVEPLSASGAGADLIDPAVQLFVERSVAMGCPAPQADELDPIVGICDLVDRLPLGIELAAARLAHLPAAELLKRLQERQQILVSRDRTATARHRTIDHLLGWSRDTLEVPERQLFDRMAVFAGPVDLPTIERVCAGDGIERGDVLDVIGSLVDRNLVVHDRERGTYSMLNLVRSFAASQVGADVVIERHRAWCIDQLESAAADDDNDEALADLMARAGDEIGLALDRAVVAGHAHDAHRIGANIWRTYEMSGRPRDGIETLRPVVELEPQTDEPSSAWAMAIEGLASLLVAAGETGEAIELHRVALRTFEQAGDARGRAWALTALSVAHLQTDPAAAASCASDALAIFEDIGDRQGTGHAHSSLGLIAARTGSLDDAERHYLEALAILRLCKQRRDAAAVLSNLGNLAHDRGELRRASRFFDGAAQLYRQIGDRRGEGLIMNNLCLVAEERGDATRARSLGEEARRLFEAIGDRQGTAAAQLNLANLAAENGDRAEALGLYRDSIESFRRAREVRGVLMGLQNLSEVAWAWGARGLGWRCEIDRATVQVRLGLVAGLRESLGRLAERAREIRDVDHAGLADRLDKVAADPVALDVEQVLAEARATDPFSATDELVASEPAEPPELADLTDRERELLALVGRGLSNAEIAGELFISRRTVDAHLSHIRAKVGVSDRVKLAVLSRHL